MLTGLNVISWSIFSERNNLTRQIKKKRKPTYHLPIYIFFRLHSTTQTLTMHAHSHPYEHTYANLTPMSIFEDRASKTSRLTKSPQASRYRRERRLPHNPVEFREAKSTVLV